MLKFRFFTRILLTTLLSTVFAFSAFAASAKSATAAPILGGEVCPQFFEYPRENLLVVMTFNVLKAWEEDLAVSHVDRLPVMHDIIAAVSPDIIGMQELYPKKDQESDPTTYKDFQQPLLARSPSLEYWYYETGMILSRFPIDIKNLHRPSVGGRNGGVRVNVPATKRRAAFSFDFYNVHLPYQQSGWEVLGFSEHPEADVAIALDNSGVEERIKALKHITKQISANTLPSIIAGDFNSASGLDWNGNNPFLLNLYPWMQGREIFWKESRFLLDAGMRDSYREVHPQLSTSYGQTWMGMWGGPEERIDYVYYKGAGLHPICSQVIGENPAAAELYLNPPQIWPSDHRALVTVFESP